MRPWERKSFTPSEPTKPKTTAVMVVHPNTTFGMCLGLLVSLSGRNAMSCDTDSRGERLCNRQTPARKRTDLETVGSTVELLFAYVVEGPHAPIGSRRRPASP